MCKQCALGERTCIQCRTHLEVGEVPRLQPAAVRARQLAKGRAPYSGVTALDPDVYDPDVIDDEWELPSAASTRIKPSSDGQAAPAGGASRSLYKDDERSAASRCGDRRDSRDVRPANEFVLHEPRADSGEIKKSRVEKP